MSWSPEKPYNNLPLLPPAIELETKAVDLHVELTHFSSILCLKIDPGKFDAKVGQALVQFNTTGPETTWCGL